MSGEDRWAVDMKTRGFQDSLCLQPGVEGVDETAAQRSSARARPPAPENNLQERLVRPG